MKIVLVTGGNRGIGLEICRQLDKLNHTVILGSRDFEKGRAASGILSKKLIVKQLDVTNEGSILELFKFIKTDFGKLDVLINNAGIGAKDNDDINGVIGGIQDFIRTNLPAAWRVAKNFKPVLQNVGMGKGKQGAANISLLSVKHIMETNFYGPWRMIQAFIPLLKKSEDGRIINMSSGMGELNNLTGDYPGYRLSKSSLNALTIMFSIELKDQGIKVNAMCPGWVKTDMGGPYAPREVSQGANTAVWLATEKEIPTGKFFRDREEINW
jgi:NAD(P)-dependent dehydrogenase (short-subunit alcohol dehydrogenase family)